MLPRSPPKGGAETLLRCFTNKIVTLSIKFCYAVEVPTLNYWSHVFMTTALCRRVCGIVSKSLILINKTYLCVGVFLSGVDRFKQSLGGWGHCAIAHQPLLAGYQKTKVISFSYGIKISAVLSFVSSQSTCVTDGRTDI